MAIEIKQLIINSSVIANDEKKDILSNQRLPDFRAMAKEIKVEVSAECQRLIRNSLRAQRER